MDVAPWWYRWIEWNGWISGWGGGFKGSLGKAVWVISGNSSILKGVAFPCQIVQNSFCIKSVTFHKCSQTQLYVSSMWQPVPGGERRTWRALRRSRAGEGETVGAESSELKHSSYSAVKRASAINGGWGVWKISAYCIERNNNVILRKQVLVRETREMRLIFTVDKVGWCLRAVLNADDVDEC